MAATPGTPDEVERPATFVGWLRRRDDRQLGRLFALRPDLALPAPPDFVALAARAGVRGSTQRAVDSLDARTLAALEALVIAADQDGLVAEPGIEAPERDELSDLALVWGDADALHVTSAAREAIGPYPRGLGRPAAVVLRTAPDLSLVPVLRHLGLPPAGQPRAGAAIAEVLGDPQRVAQLLAECDPAEREVLDRLAAGPPVGALRSDVDGDGLRAPARRLLERGLLVPIDTHRVELPRELGIALRDADAVGPSADPPVTRTVEREPDELDRLGTTAVREALRLVDALAELWTAQPPALLRSGGIGVRDLRRTARELGVGEPTVAVIAEVAHAAGLLNSTNGAEPGFLPSTEYDDWRVRDTAARWLTLASGLADHDPPARPGEPARRSRPGDRGTRPGRRTRHHRGAAPAGPRRAARAATRLRARQSR